jgi:uncharacterized protein YndB with AHSA1/START domain
MLTGMSQPDDLTIERTTDLDLSAADLWSLISTAEGWRSWLVDDAQLAVERDATGTATEDGVVREVRIDTVVEGRGINFSWWDRDDPSSSSYVQLHIVELPDGRTQLHIAEQFIDGSPSAAMSAEATLSWDVRMVSLWLLALHSTVMA